MLQRNTTLMWSCGTMFAQNIQVHTSSCTQASWLPKEATWLLGTFSFADTLSLLQV